MSGRPLSSGATLGARLERMRLEHRAVRIEQVLLALRSRERAHAAAHGVPPVPLRQAIAEFDGELSRVRGLLAVP